MATVRSLSRGHPSKVLIPPSTMPEPWGQPGCSTCLLWVQAAPGSRGPLAMGFLSFSGCFGGSPRAGNLGYKLVGLQYSLCWGFSPAFFPSELHGAWTSWDWGPDTRDAWGVNSSESLTSYQARAACCVQEILNILSLKEGTWNSSKITLNTSAGSYREGRLGESVKITLAEPGKHTASGWRR